jgi:hypothetical protein
VAQPAATDRPLDAEHLTPFHTVTNAIEALNRQLRKTIKTKGHFPKQGRRPQADLPRARQRRAAMDQVPELGDRAAGVQNPLRRPAARHCKLTVTPSPQPESLLHLHHAAYTESWGRPRTPVVLALEGLRTRHKEKPGPSAAP